MVGIILIENEAGLATLQSAVRSIMSKAGQAQLCVITDNSFESTDQIIRISKGSRNWHDLLNSAIEQMSCDRLLLMDVNLTINSELCDRLFTEVTNTSDQSISYLPYQGTTDLVELPDMSTDALVELIAYQPNWPVRIISTPTSFIKDFGNSSALSVSEYLAGILVHATNAACNIQGFDTIADSRLPVLENETPFTESERTRLMRLVVSSCNIEDLFPNYAWSEWSQESAAAAYHSLAAHFIRLGDTDAALECLGLSDHLEDSPRSLALKGLIAIKQGEQLTAVANMVSSLQQYEIRKKQSNEHYLSFTPKDMAEVNRRLNLGLKALNQRDNETAAFHFAEAIFDFDGFYRKFGVTL